MFGRIKSKMAMKRMEMDHLLRLVNLIGCIFVDFVMSDWIQNMNNSNFWLAENLIEFERQNNLAIKMGKVVENGSHPVELEGNNFGGSTRPFLEGWAKNDKQKRIKWQKRGPETADIATCFDQKWKLKREGGGRTFDEFWASWLGRNENAISVPGRNNQKHIIITHIFFWLNFVSNINISRKNVQMEMERGILIDKMENDEEKCFNFCARRRLLNR
jgi:hypothetical protein